MINIQIIDDNQCYKWRLARYLHPADHNPKIIIKADMDFIKNHDFKNVKLPVKIRDNHKIKKKILLTFLVMKTKKNIQSICQKMLCRKT